MRACRLPQSHDLGVRRGVVVDLAPVASDAEDAPRRVYDDRAHWHVAHARSVVRFGQRQAHVLFVGSHR